MERVNKEELLYFTNIPAPYTVEFLEKLSEFYSITVLYQRNTAIDRKPEWIKEEGKGIKSIVLKGRKYGADLAFCPSVIKYLNRKYKYIIIGDYNSRTGILAILYLKLKNIPFCIHMDGAKLHKENNIIRKIKNFLICSANGYFSSGKVTTEYMKYYGANEEHIYEYPFTSVNEEEVLNACPSKEFYKKELNLGGLPTILSVGRMLECKGYDTLIKSIKNLNYQVNLYIVGADPTEELKELIKNNTKSNICFIPHVDKNTVYKFMRAADVFVLATRGDTWGLVINEAMSQGVPVISTDSCVAALSMINDGINGYIVRTDDVNGLSQRISELIHNPLLRQSIAQQGLITAREYTIEKMVDAYVLGLKQYDKTISDGV